MSAEAILGKSKVDNHPPGLSTGRARSGVCFELIECGLCERERECVYNELIICLNCGGRFRDIVCTNIPPSPPQPRNLEHTGSERPVLRIRINLCGQNPGFALCKQRSRFSVVCFSNLRDRSKKKKRNCWIRDLNRALKSARANPLGYSRKSCG